MFHRWVVLCITGLAVVACSPIAAHAQTVRPDLYVTDQPVLAMAQRADTLYIGGNFTWIGPATGSGVRLDGITGERDNGYPKVLGTVFTVVADGSGGWYIGGNFIAVGGIQRRNLAHILADSSVAAWNPDPDGDVQAIEVSGATVYVGGYFSTIGGETRKGLAALDASSGLATAWDPAATQNGQPGGVYAIELSGATVYVGGTFTHVGGQQRLRIAALDAATGLATSWDPSADSPVYALVVSGFTVYAGGGFYTIGGQVRIRLAALDAKTGLATSFDPSPSGGPGDPQVTSLALVGATLYVGGLFANIGGAARIDLAALDTGTGLATSWDPSPNGFAGTQTYVSQLATIGAIVYVCGGFTNIGGQARYNLAAIDGTTGLANEWDPKLNGSVYTVAVAGPSVFAGGSFTSAGCQRRNYIAAIDLGTGSVTPWDPSANYPVEALAASGSTIYAAGDFGTIGGAIRGHLAALNATTGLATGWDPNANGSVDALMLHGSSVLVGGAFDQVGGQPRLGLAELDRSTGMATAWDPSAGGYFASVGALADGGGTVYVGGYFTDIGGQPRTNLAEVDLTTGNATSWSPNPAGGNSVSALAVSGSTVYVGGSFTGIGGQSRANLAAIDRASGLATAWDPSPDGNVLSLGVSGNAVYAGGGFYNIGGQARRSLAALDANTGLATIWAPNPNGPVFSLALNGSTVFAGGYFTRIGGLPQAGIASIGDLTTPTLLSLVSADATSERVRLMWYSGSDVALVATVYRRSGSEPWTALASVTADGTGRLSFEDAAVLAGVRYGYRVGVVDGGRETFLGETWVEVPRVSGLSLAGVLPNPVSDVFAVRFTLPSASPARLELIDLAGRRVLAREVGSLGAGSHTLDVSEGRALAPGVYVLRLESGGRAVTRRAVVVR